MVINVADPNKDCRFCYHAQRESENGIEVDTKRELYCPVKKCFVDYEMATECATNCDDRDINPDWVMIHRALLVGEKYVKTGDRRVFFR